jgi:outer membrane receptor protein involved in Fe transport
MTNSSRHLRQAVHLTLAAVATTAGAGTAFAQEAPASTAPSASVQEVVVTGSRLQLAPNDVSISPVASVTSADIQQSGLVRVEDMLNNLPQVIAENSSGQSISSNGTSTVSLRGLGSVRTLVLINGRRMSPGAGLNTSGSPDINQIPAELIERADVLTGGASAVYGADAVAGVVNFVLNTKFEGVKLDANYSFANHKNDDAVGLDALQRKGYPIPATNINAGFTKDASVLVGANFADGRGNATMYATYLNVAPVVGYQYDYTGCTLNTPGTLSLPGANPGRLSCGGSSSSATGRFLEFGIVNGVFTTLADKTVNPGVPGGAFRDYSSGRDSYNYGALSYLQRQQERYTMGGFLTFALNDHASVYSETMFARNTSRAEYGPSGLFAFGAPQISCSNPLWSAAEKADFCSPASIAANQAAFGTTGDVITLYAARRSVESGPRIDNYTSNSIRQVLGVKGNWGEAWSYDLYGQYGLTQMADIEGGFLGANQINYALNVVTNPATGQPACAVALNGVDPTCVPWNIWQPGGVTPAQLAYLTVPSSYNVQSTEFIVSGSVNGDFGKYGWQLPGASSGLQASFGAEYRQERYQFDPDYIFGNGLASGGNGKFSPIDGGFHVSEVFTEFRLPIFDGRPGAYALNLEGGYRYSTYTEGFNTNTYKFGIEWAPIQDVRLRGSYNRAVRAPNIGELFTPQVVGSGGTADPCWGPTPTYTLAQCEKTGVTPAEYGHITSNPAAQINTTIGGNLNLVPEVADTYSFGFVFQPQAAPNFVFTADYYDIKITNTITNLTSNTVLAYCANTGDPTVCGWIHRGANTGSLWFNNTNFIETNSQNIGQLRTKGIDIASHYKLNMGTAGKLNFSLTGTKVNAFLTQPLPQSGAYDCTGYFGSTCGAPTPKWKHVFVTTWQTPWAGLDLTMKWRFLGAVDVDRSSTDPQLAASYLAQTSRIPNYSYFDLSASMPIVENVNFRLGINNIADKHPPLVANGNYSDCPNTSCNDNTWVGTYDTLGRWIFAHVSVKF